MKREIITTEDGYKTIHLSEINESYHSTHGALQEALHVFIENGWKRVEKQTLNILEIGFGTGLNAILTLIRGEKDQKKVHYTSIEAFPIDQGEMEDLGYYKNEFIQNHQAEYLKMHDSEWNQAIPITPTFTLEKIHQQLADYTPEPTHYNLIYFDAFGYRVQPEMWSKEVFQKMFDSLTENGYLVTYSSKGIVRRTLLEIGFQVEKVPGPAGKREMLVAQKR